MKLIRHLSSTGPAWASWLAEGSALAISGDPFGTWALTETVVAPGPLLAPVVPPAIIGIGLNYRKHAEEMKRTLPTYPMWFVKTPNTVQAPGAPIELPRTLRSEAVDYEGELAVVIGRACRNVRPEHALDYVLGYTCANDVSARDWQFTHGGGQFCQGKSFDTFCPLGPWLVTRDELPDPGALRLRTLVNGEERQQGHTSDLIFNVPALIAFLSASKTLLPGTVILTGTPDGVGHSFNPPRYLQPGDTVRVEIEGIGALENPVRAEAI